MKIRALGIVIAVLFLIVVTGCSMEETVSKKSNESTAVTAEKPVEQFIPEADNTTLNFCREFCYFVRGGEKHNLEYNQSSEKFFCQCFDYSKELLVSKEITERDLELYTQKLVYWEDLPITYQIMNEDDCGDYETRKIHRAFAQIQEATNNVVQFQEVKNKEDADIELTCKYLQDCYKKKIDIRKEEGVIYEYESICQHEAGLAQITHYEGFALKKARIDLIGLAGFAETNGYGASGFYIGSCGHTTVEVHEILHVLGFRHTNNPESVMYHQTELIPYTLQKEGACLGSEKKIDQEIIDDLLFVYGE